MDFDLMKLLRSLFAFLFFVAASLPAPAAYRENMGNVYDIKDVYHAAFDSVALSVGIATAGSKTFTAAGASFKSSDCLASNGAGCTGKTAKIIDIDFAGPGCGPLHTTIAAVINSTTITLANAATCTTGYNYNFLWKVVTAQSGAGSYVPGNQVCLVAGTFTVQSCATVTSTTIAAATIINGGANGLVSDGTGSGTCYVIGTTGGGVLGLVSVTLTAGVITAINGPVSARGGVYTANPTTLANEPVLPTENCTGLTGAVLSLTMGVMTASPGNHANGGQYSVIPPAIASTTSNGAGTGLTVTPIWYLAGTFVYGTDDTQAWTNAFNSILSLAASGNYSCLSLPAGISMITAQLPMLTRGPCIKGLSREKSFLYLSSVFTGKAIWIDGTWTSTPQSSPNDGTPIPASSALYGTDVSDFTIFGSRYAPGTQDGLILSDANNFVKLSSLMIRGLNGTCFGSGKQIFDVRGFTNESKIDQIQTQQCGSPTSPATYFESDTVGSSDDLYVTDFNVYAPFGIGLQIAADGAANTAVNHFDRVRVEGLPYQPQLIAADLLVIGDTVKTGGVSDIWMDKVQLINPYVGQYALRIDAPNSTDAPFSLHINAMIGGGRPYGAGILINYARNSEIHISSMLSYGINLTTAATMGGAVAVDSIACQNVTWTKSIAGPNPVISPVCYSSATASKAGFLSYSDNDNSVNGGCSLNSNSVNLSFARAMPTQCPSGISSASIASQNLTSTGNHSFDAASFSGNLSGTYTEAVGTYGPDDHGWPTSKIESGFSLVSGRAGNQVQRSVIGCKTAATNGATCILTADGTGTPSALNILNPGSNTAMAVPLTCSAHDSTANTNAIAWFNYAALFLIRTSSASIIGAFGTKPTPVSIGTITGADINPSTNTTFGGAQLTFTAPTINSSVWVITCSSPTVQTN